jgi:ribonuclease HII
VYSTTRGLAELERGVHALLLRSPSVATLRQFLQGVAPDDLDEILGEPWFTGTSAVPANGNHAEVAPLFAGVDDACNGIGVVFRLIRCVVVCAPRFNAFLEASGSKGAVLSEALRRLLHCCRETLPGDDRLVFFVDKHGGRNTYAAQIQHALATGIVVVRHEGMAGSEYEVLGLDREVRLTFQPRADREHFCVALASMTSKYLRELLMGEFNAFWQRHAPGVKPTAGYPGDAARFFKDIAPAARRLGISEGALWRRK